ncbi:uncharacterized protein LOC142322852 [Lycorma delicatula]|uniref:uncharacterized protein LOC142322852 n=1 Tax=Lycorma delicatula TaxID=130591 RepID=UPI003F517404
MRRYGIAVVCTVLCSILVSVSAAVDRHLEVDEPLLLPTVDVDPTAPSSVVPTMMAGNLGSVFPTVFGENLQQLVDLTAEATLNEVKSFRNSIQDALDGNNNNIQNIISSNSGEGYRALGRARSLAVLKPERTNDNSSTIIHASNNQTNNNSAGRTSSPDIQDLISGFVKLLNTNVQATQPVRPLRTRINNRGPPRITDLVLPPPTRPPYLFQRPPPPPPPLMHLPAADPIRPYIAGVPLPEQIVPRPGPPPATTFSPPSIITPLTRPTFTLVTEPSVSLVNLTSDLSLNATSVIDITVEPTTERTVDLIGYEFNVNKTRTDQPVKFIFQDKGVDNVMNIAITSLSSSNSFRPSNTLLTKPLPSSSSSPSLLTTSIISSTSSTTSLSSLSSPSSSSSSSSSPSSSSMPTLSPSSSVTFSLSSPSSIASLSSHPSSTSSSLSHTRITPSTIINHTLHKTETPLPSQKTEVTPSLSVTTSGVATVIESSMQDFSTEIHHKPTRWQSSTVQTDQTYYPRPGIVLDDPEYKPGGGISKPQKTVHQHHHTPSLGDIFDVTVSAVQVDSQPQAAQTGQPFIYPVEVDGVSVITTAEAGQHFVSIDGKRTYINLQGGPVNPPNNNNNNGKTGVGHVSASTEKHSLHQHRKTIPGRPYYHRPTHPPVRIDTCIVGDDSTCDAVQHEHCRTEFGVSSCQCRPGYSRRRHREPCHRVVSFVLSLRVDRLYEHRVVWSDKLLDRDSKEFLQIEYEANRAIDSALSMTPYSDEFVGSRVNNVYKSSTGVYVNMTIQLEDFPSGIKKSEESLVQDMHHQLVAAIHRRGNNIGNSGLWVDSPPGSVSQVYDLDECSSSELHDCHVNAICRNVFGSFRCLCHEGLRDPMAADELRSGRRCEACPPDLCGHRGHCYYEANSGQPVCKCLGNFYGAQCQIDGEVLGVAIGASLLAVLIIAGTLACLCVWSRKWSREDDGVTQYPPYTLRGLKVPQYGVCLDERLRWAQMADATNHYAPEPVCRVPPICTPTQLYGRAPPPPGPLSSSEEDDLHLLGGGTFHVPRPKSTSNESAIYWTAEYSHHTGPRMVTAQF